MSKKKDNGNTVVEEAPTGGHVDLSEPDVADLDSRRRAGEEQEPILVGSWVRIGKAKGVEDRFVGKIAAVVRSKQISCECEWSDEDHLHQDPDRELIVRVRDERAETISIPLAAVAEKAQDRVTLQPYG